METPHNILKVWTSSCEERRLKFLHEMDRLKDHHIDCSECTGICCTFVANSMKITPLETADILDFLLDRSSENSIDVLQALIKKMDDTIKAFRLDAPSPGNGKKEFLRRTYTCPFYLNKNLGCSLERKSRPYGCLGFNPRKGFNKEGDDCGIDKEIQTMRETTFKEIENQYNVEIRKKFAPAFEKEYLPIALKKMAQIYVNFLTPSKF